MTQPMRTRSRRPPPKIVGNTARAPEALRSLSACGPRERVGKTGPSGRPGMRNFPRARHAAPLGECHRSTAVAIFLARQAERERAIERERAAARAAAETQGKRRGAAGTRKPWRGRPGIESPGLSHCPAVSRPEAPPLRETGARASDPTPWTTRRTVSVRRDHARLHPARPRPSRALAELVADAQA